MKPRILLKTALVVGLTFLLVGGLGFLSLSRLREDARTIVDDTLPGLVYAGAANATLAQAFNRTLMLLLSEEPETRRKLSEEIGEFSAQTTSHLENYQRRISKEVDQANFAQLLKARTNYFNIRAEVLTLADAGRNQEAMAMCRTKLLEAYTAYKTAGDVLFQYNKEQSELRSREIMADSRKTQFAVAIIGIGVFILGFLLGLFR